MQGRQTTRSVASKVRENLTSDKFIVIEGTNEAVVSKEDFFNAVQALIVCGDCGVGGVWIIKRPSWLCL